MPNALALSWCSVVLALSGAGCSSPMGTDADSGVADSGGADSGGADSSRVADSNVVDSGGADSSRADGGTVSTDAGRDAGATDAASATDTASAITVVLSGFSAFGNCMPMVPPDPIRASWTATVNGASGTTATLTSATLTISGSATVVQHLTVDAPVIALAGGRGSAAQTKVAADVNPPAACGELCGGATAHLVVTFLIDGVTISASADAPYQCAF